MKQLITYSILYAITSLLVYAVSDTTTTLGLFLNTFAVTNILFVFGYYGLRKLKESLRKRFSKSSISAKMILHSKSKLGYEIATMLVKMPRKILAQFNKHRVFSNSAGSTRAIPFMKMVRMILKDMYIPQAFQKKHKGMQGTEYYEDIVWLQLIWYLSGLCAVLFATILHKIGITKQLANALLTPYMYQTVVVTSTEWDNFFQQRCPRYTDPFGNEWFNKYGYKAGTDPDMHPTTPRGWLKINKGHAEVPMMELAECMWDCLMDSTPKPLVHGMHLPFTEHVDIEKLKAMIESGEIPFKHTLFHSNELMFLPTYVVVLYQISTAASARTSYLNFYGKQNHLDDCELFDFLKDNAHWSPSEHPQKEMTEDNINDYVKTDYDGTKQIGWCRNSRGFIQLRAMID